VVYPQIVTLGVAWTLVIEVLFYIMIFFISPVFKKNPVVALSLEVIVVIFILQTARNWGNGYFLFAASASYLPYLIAGQLIYLFHKKYIGITTFSLFSFMTYGLMVAQLNIMYPQFLVRENSYLISCAYAYSLFCVAFLLRSYIKQFKIISFASNTSYSLYLYHGTVGFALLEYLSKFTQNRWVILPVVFICYLVAYLAYRLVEIPSIRLAKLLAEKINLRYST
jgi:peptidoglycan/LPS O-acetylase OafA/YrhL